MNPKRISVKLFATQPVAEATVHAFIPLFHRFIQTGAVEGLLVDVADYVHVPTGPGVILVGHDVDYAMDFTDARPGLLVVAKHFGDQPLADVLRDTLRRALVAAVAIEADGATGVEFAVDAAEIRVLDRLVAPNTDEAFGKAEPEVRRAVAQAFGEGASIERSHAADARQALGATAKAAAAVDVQAAIERLGGRQLTVPAAAPQSAWDITVEKLREIRDQGLPHVLVDVREAHEFEICNLGGKLIPLGEIADRLHELDAKAHVIVHCKVGGRGAKAVAKLREAGFEDAWNVTGGIHAWIDRIDSTLKKY